MVLVKNIFFVNGIKCTTPITLNNIFITCIRCLYVCIYQIVLKLWLIQIILQVNYFISTNIEIKQRKKILLKEKH
jgi:hypothetical protein